MKICISWEVKQLHWEKHCRGVDIEVSINAFPNAQ